MKKLPGALLPFLLLLAAASEAVEIEVGDRTLEIPIPAGYAELTPEMSPTYETMHAYVVPGTERYMILVSNEDAEAVLRGKDAGLERYLMVQAERQSARIDITQSEFDERRDAGADRRDFRYSPRGITRSVRRRQRFHE